MNVLIVGAGMYVTGRGGHGGGTVLAALAQASRELPVGRVVVIATAETNRRIVTDYANWLNRELGSHLEVYYRTINPLALADETKNVCRVERIDAAIVATPDHLHFEAVKSLILSDVHTLVVKPFVSNMMEARELIRIQSEKPVYGAVEFHKRFDESNLYAKKAYSEGQLGDLSYVTVDYSQRMVIPTGVFSKWAQQTNVFQYLGVHYVDLIHFITGYEPTALCAYGTKGILNRHGLDCFDSVHVMIEWRDPQEDADKFIAILNVNWIDPENTSAMSDQQFKIVGSLGRLECDQKKRGVELVTGSGVSHINPYFSEFLPDVDERMRFTGYGYESIRQFVMDVDGILEGRVDPLSLVNRRPSFRQALLTTAVVDAVNQALSEEPGWRSIDDLS